MKKYGIKLALAAAVFCMAMPFASFAGTWKSDANGMWYQFDDGTYPKGRWAWIDTDNDGMAESFYFDSNGYVLRNTTTPDGYQVNRIGAWVVGGEVKQKAGGETKNSTSGNGSSSENQKNSNNSYSNDPEWYLKAADCPNTPVVSGFPVLSDTSEDLLFVPASVASIVSAA